MRRKTYGYYSHVKTTQERKYSEDEDHKQFVRAKRNKKNLPDLWEEKPIIETRSWKDSRKKQYRVGGRGEKHVLELKSLDYLQQYKLKRYFEQHNIPFKIDIKYRLEVRHYTISVENKIVGFRPKYQHVWKDGSYVTDYNHQIGWSPIYRTIYLKEPKKVPYNVKMPVKYIITWWSNKNIGIDKILKK